MYAISRSVGAWEKGAVNLTEDVRTVQSMLVIAARNTNNPALDPKEIDGLISRPAKDSATVDAIKAFQAGFLSTPDGLIEVNKNSWHKLLDVVEGVNTGAVNPNVGGPFFPFPELPLFDWTVSPRKFGANRDGGARAHAGSDLYFPQGTWIYAIADGTVVRGPYAFYSQTYALEIDHGTFIARYGEIQENTLVRTGDHVTAGRKIARVGHLVGIQVPSDMLHLELYDKSVSGALTRSGSSSKTRADGVPFQRRKDLIDPTPFLNHWKTNLPTPY